MITNVWKSKHNVVLLCFIMIGILTMVIKMYSHRDMIEFVVSFQEQKKIPEIQEASFISSSAAKPITTIKKINKFALESQAMRNKTLQRFCEKYQIPSNLKYNRNFLYSDTKKFVYCRIAKVACKTWKKIIGFLEGLYESPYNVTYHQLYGIPLPYLKDFVKDKEPDELAFRETGYFSFFYSRHPFDRLYSAYRNKFGEPVPGLESYLRKYGPRIVEANGKDPKTHPKRVINGRTFQNISFEEFARFVLTAGDRTDMHWERQTRACHICKYNFSYLGKFETMARDANTLFEMLGVAEVDKLPEDGQYDHKAADYLRKAYAKLPKKLVDDIYEFYKVDFEAFGYDRHEYF